MGPLLQVFYKNLELKPKSFLLSYLILPMVLYRPSRNFLVKARKTSTIRTYLKEKDRIYGLGSRVESYKSLTNLSFQRCIDNQSLQLCDNLSVRLLELETDHQTPSDMIKSAGNLGMIFVDDDIVSIFRKLGLKKL